MPPNLRSLLQWLGLGTLVGTAAGLATVVFLVSLEAVTTWREAHPAIIYALPGAGLVLGWVYQRWGAPIAGGNNLIIDTLHDNRPELPWRMAPMVLIGTLATHLFGGSAGREGTAVQMGAGLADALAHRLKVSAPTRSQCIAAGMAGGFGAVFGTPIAGTIFGLEVLVIGSLDYHALLPALVAALVGDFVTRHMGIVHAGYPSVAPLPLDPLLLGKWLVVGAAVALASVAFIELTHAIKHYGPRLLPSMPLRLCAGGAAVVGLWQLTGGSTDYLGVGDLGIARAFEPGGLPFYGWALKLLFTALTLGAGFLGGEVTPLFFIGAALGNVLAPLLNIPTPLCAGVCLAALFGAAANAPLALALMAAELLGVAVLPHVLVVTVTAYLLSGQRSIYPSQRVTRHKHGGGVFHKQRPVSQSHE